MQTTHRRRLDNRWWGVAALVATGALAWGLLAADSAQTLAYGTHERALADVRRAAGPGPHPAMLLIHGGAWQGGSRRDMEEPARWLASAGVTTVAIDYRLVTAGARWPEIRDDVTQAMWWLREHAGELGIDPQRVGVLGNSAGGHLGAWLATTDTVSPRGTHSRPQLLIAWGSPWDLSQPQEFAPPVQEAMHRLLAGADPAQASPLARIDAHSAPALLVHGPRDDVVDPVQSRRACAALQRAGVECRLLLPAGEGHDGTHEPGNEKAVLEAMQQFVAARLRGEGPHL